MSLGSFFKNFGKNIKADPASTLKGFVSLAAAGATAYGMATGKVPVNELSLGAASAMATSGIHAIGSNTAQITALEPVIQEAAAIIPQAITVADHYEAIRKETDKATATLSAAMEGLALLEQLKAKPADVKR